jgi:hypothetical protein
MLKFLDANDLTHSLGAPFARELQQLVEQTNPESASMPAHL